MQRQIEELEERVLELEKILELMDAYGKNLHNELRNTYISNSELLQRLIQVEGRIERMGTADEDVIMSNPPTYISPDYLLNECQSQAREIIMRNLKELGASMGRAIYEALQKIPVDDRLNVIIAIENKKIYCDEFAKFWINHQYGTELGLYDQHISETGADDENVGDPIDIYPLLDIPKWTASSEKEEETVDNLKFASYILKVSPTRRCDTSNDEENNESSDKEDESIKDGDSG